MHVRPPRFGDLAGRLRRRLAATRSEEGFAMIIALVVLVVAGLMAAVALSAETEDNKLTHTYIVQQEAYAAAQAGIQEFKYELGSNNNYWATCPKTSKPLTVPGTTNETYTYRFLHSEKHTQKECEEKKQAAMIETSGSANGTFRVEATGSVPGECGEKVLTEKGFTENAKGKVCTRSIVTTFTHPGFINYVFVSNYEILDPVATSPEPKDCEEYYKERKEKSAQKKWGGDCQEITWAATDKVKGPFHTNDGALVATGATFGREGHNDSIEMNQGHYEGTPKINGSGYTESAGTLLPPETDAELLESAESGYKLKGRVELQLEEGSPNKIKVTKWTAGKAETETKNFPANGVVYVEDGSKGCPIKYTPFGPKYTGDSECGNAYIKGTYNESLTIGAANDVIVIGNTTTTGGGSGGEPTGTATLGLIATNFVRVYHPVKETSCGSTCENTSSNCNEENMTKAETEALSKELFGATPESLIVDAAILSTKHSWIVDNYLCGNSLGTLTVWGSIAQFWRGPVGTGGTHGFSSKNYNYDERLATNQPPSFLSPTTTGAWKAERETAPPEE
jgi:Tfp pilus assembly protein PilE